MIQWPWQENWCYETAEFGKRLYLIGDEHKKQTDTRVCVAEKSDDPAFLEL